MHDLLIAIGAALCCVPAAVLFAKDAQSTPTTTTLVTNAETVVAVGAALTVPNTTGKAVVKVFLVLNAGTSSNIVTVRIYRGTSASGTLIGTAIPYSANFTPGGNTSFLGTVTDVLSGVGTAQYCVTLQQSAAIANGVLATVLLETEILSG